MRISVNDPELYLRSIGSRWLSPRHYYGDVVRALFLGATIIMLVGAPFYSTDLTAQLPYIVVGAVLLVALAALTSPRSAWTARFDAAAAAVGATTFQAWALWQYSSEAPIEFVLREIPALIFFFALYYSVKTLRAMMQGQVDPDVVAGLKEQEIVDPIGTEGDGLGHLAAREQDGGSD